MTRRRGSDSSRDSGGLGEQLKTLLIAVAIALAIRAFVIEPFTIPSGSMLPTLLIGDHLFVNKFIYGIRIPWTGIRLPGVREPRRGDVVVFSVGKRGNEIAPVDRRPDLPPDNFVKRIIGVPGDRIEIQKGRVVVNGEALDLRDTGETFTDGFSRALSVRRERAGEREHALLDDPDVSARLPSGPWTIEAGRFFVMGDNRDHSNDSRVWGTVRMIDLKGPAFVLYWSWNYNGSWAGLLNPLTWFRLLSDETRWGRVGDAIE
jgi:signal peptidase I